MFTQLFSNVCIAILNITLPSGSLLTTKPSIVNHSFELYYCSIEEQLNIMKQKLFNYYRQRSSLTKQNMVYQQNVI